LRACIAMEYTRAVVTVPVFIFGGLSGLNP
jgi:hypothetical protein